ncbi:hypothetical protein KL928_004447 [Ogataea angusta]|uniref:Maf-like protein n=1 Tax=Pichia angusta TaxID=870730 RepID=A0AAN6DCA6_PICAN|nr:uncharacterized protein KL928_004447 [Ogataea angusta]KAG7816983.1 hypothetical protein KL928_004447 [Ogataea angusta]KAG7837944.1 hypothetical protein KL943_000020 [Ogataea angusta]
MATRFEHPVYDKLSNYSFYLCSTSPRRQEILNMLGFCPVIRPSHFEENLSKLDYTVEEYVAETARGKCLAVWDQLKKEGKTDNVLLLSADTVVENEGVIYEKPKTQEENYRAICKMRDSNEPVRVISGVVMLLSDASTRGKPDRCKIKTFTEITEIIMEKSVSDEFVRKYSECGEGHQVAGGFKIQGSGALMMRGINGDYYNVLHKQFIHSGSWQRRKQVNEVWSVGGGLPSQVNDEWDPSVVGDGLSGVEDLGDSLFGLFRQVQAGVHDEECSKS